MSSLRVSVDAQSVNTCTRLADNVLTVCQMDCDELAVYVCRLAVAPGTPAGTVLNLCERHARQIDPTLEGEVQG